MCADGPELGIVAAVARNGVIGHNKTLPWHLPADLAHFKRLTLDRTILMGRRTWQSLPGPLPRRRHLVLSRNPDLQLAGATVVDSIAGARAAAAGEDWLLVIGGAALYAAALPLARRMDLTLVDAEPAGDVYFPEWDPAQWRAVTLGEHPADAHHAHAMRFVQYQRVACDSAAQSTADV